MQATAQSRNQRSQMSPEARAYQEDMARGIYTREGTMVAFPTCFPGETSPIVHDESRITALDCKPDGTMRLRIHIHQKNSLAKLGKSAR